MVIAKECVNLTLYGSKPAVRASFAKTPRPRLGRYICRFRSANVFSVLD
jgi:hypothetical protein